MTFALVCTIVFFALCVASDMAALFKYVCIFMCLYAAYTVAAQLGVVQELLPKEWNPLLDWGKECWSNLKKS